MNVNITNLDSNFEKWASIDGYLNYQVSWWGRVVNTRTGRILKPGTCTGGYLIVNLSKDGRVKVHKIHTLVAREWVPNPEGKGCVDHRDGDRTNNHHENLRAATQSENLVNMKNAKIVQVCIRGFRFIGIRASGKQELSKQKLGIL